MQPLGLDDVLGRERYGVHRDAIRRRVIAYKHARRLALGELLTLVFEDRLTVWYQTQEMLWVENITDLDGVRGELAVYNQLLPGPEELSATLFVEVGDPARIAQELARLIGIDEQIVLRVEGGEPVRAQFEPGRATAEKLSAVQYLRFPLSDGAGDRIRSGAAMALASEHLQYRVEVAVPERVRVSLVADLAGTSAGDGVLRDIRHAD